MPQDPYMFTDFSGKPDQGLLDPSRATDNFKGGIHLVGQRGPEDGNVAGSYDTNPNNAKGTPANASTVYGVDFQGKAIGGDII